MFNFGKLTMFLALSMVITLLLAFRTFTWPRIWWTKTSGAEDQETSLRDISGLTMERIRWAWTWGYKKYSFSRWSISGNNCNWGSSLDWTKAICPEASEGFRVWKSWIASGNSRRSWGSCEAFFSLWWARLQVCFCTTYVSVFCGALWLVTDFKWMIQKYNELWAY